ncbi:MAG: hypothetical protein AB1327_06440 [Bacillota bacterium]
MELSLAEAVFQGFPETAAVWLLAFALLGIPWRAGPVLLFAALSLGTVAFIRSLDAPFGLHTLVLTAVLAAAPVIVYRVQAHRAVITALVVSTALAVCEIIGSGVSLAVLGATPEDMAASEVISIVTGLPQVLMLLFLAVLVRTRGEKLRRRLGL